MIKILAEKIHDNRFLRLIDGLLRAGYLEQWRYHATLSGSPQGGVISPLLANIYLHGFDQQMQAAGFGELVRYADDFVIQCRTREQAEAALDLAGVILGRLGLQLHPGKTKLVDLRAGREGFDFLGCHFRARMSGRLWEQKRIVRYYLHRWPSQKAMKRLRDKVKNHTDRRRVGVDVSDVIDVLNPILRGWGNYFATGNAADKFIQIDRYVVLAAQTLAGQEAGPQLARRPGRSMDSGLVP
jgi:RNA-directed DNA polymerase